MIKFEKQRILWQILLWWGIWLFISFFLTNGIEHPERFLERSLVLLLGVALIVQLNVRYLLPRLYFRQYYFGFIIAGSLLLVVTVLLLYSEYFPWAEWLNPRGGGSNFEPRRGRERNAGFRWLGRLMPFIVAFLGSSLTEIARYANRKTQEAIQLEKEKLATELKFLKSQVNPHFVFNALNNIYSMAVTQAPQTPESIMQLAEILRYMVYDSNEKLVALKSEITYIENYVGLKQLKDSRGFNVQLELDRTHPELLVPPLLFIPLVENAFKHSKIEDLRTGFIRIQLRVEDDQLSFHVSNSVPETTFTKDRAGGVGLDNIRKRLALIYPAEQYELAIRESPGQFTAHLKIAV